MVNEDGSTELLWIQQTKTQFIKKKMVEQVDSLGSTVFWLNKLNWFSVINSCLEIVIGEGGHQEWVSHQT